MLAGLTLDEAEQKIEEAYESEYAHPHALPQVNNRVLVFREAGQATNITPNQTRPSSKPGLGWGIRQSGPADQAHPGRGEDNLVYHMDLSTVQGLEAARTIVQANDIIYVDSNPRVREVLADVPCGPIGDDFHVVVVDVSSVADPRLMEVQTTPLKDCCSCVPAFGDARGSFSETNQRAFDEAGEEVRFVQANESRSRPGVARTPFPIPPHAQGKLVRVKGFWTWRDLRCG